MSDFNKFIRAGVEYTFAGVINTKGRLIGSTGTAPTAGAIGGSGMFRVKGVKSANPNVPDPEVVAATGDDTIQGTFIFDSGSPSQFEVTKSVFDLNFDALAQDILIRDFADAATTVMRPNPVDYPDFCLIFNSRTKKKEQALEGKKAWSGYIVPVSTVFPRFGNGMTERTVADDLLNVIMQPTGTYPWGLTMTTLLNGTEQGDAIPFNADYPLHMQRFTGDNSRTTFQLDYTPISVAKTLAVVSTASSDFGAAVTVSSVSPSLKQLTLAIAPAQDAELVVLYQFQP